MEHKGAPQCATKGRSKRSCASSHQGSMWVNDDGECAKELPTAQPNLFRQKQKQPLLDLNKLLTNLKFSPNEP